MDNMTNNDKDSLDDIYIRSYFHEDTSTFAYLASDRATGECAVIDSVLDYDLETKKHSTQFADQIISDIRQNDLKLKWILETHIHADHITAASYIKKQLGGVIAISHGVLEVLQYWVANLKEKKAAHHPNIYDNTDIPLDGSQFDRLLQDKDTLDLGQTKIRVISTTGHTPSCVSYLIGNAIFTGDTIFAPNMGTSRADFPGGSAETLYDSIQKIFSLPDDANIFIGHDYPKEGEKPQCKFTVGQQKQHNIMINSAVSKKEYTAKRQARDATLIAPKLIYPAVELNLLAGDC